MRREPETLLAPGAVYLLLRAPIRVRFLRRLLIVGGFLVCGWLLGGAHSAYADDPPLPVPAAVGTGAAGGVSDTVGKVKDTVDEVAAPAKDRTPAPAKPEPRAKPEKVLPEKVVPEKVVPEKVVPEKVVPERVAAPPARAAKKAPATRAIADTVGAVTQKATETVERTTSGVASTKNQVVGSATTTLTRPLDTLPATVSTLTAPVSTLTAPLGSLGVNELLGQVEGATAGLVPQVNGVVAPVTAKSALLGAAGVTTANVGETLLEPESAYPSADPLGVPLGASTLAGSTASTAVCQVASAPILYADPLRVAGPTRPPSAAEGTAKIRGPGRMPWPSPAPGGEGSSQQGMRSGLATDDPMPGAPLVPRSADPSHALPTSSHSDGIGDAPRPWEVRVHTSVVLAWADSPAAVRTAADEPGFSPD